jgi:hypothetical protein
MYLFIYMYYISSILNLWVALDMEHVIKKFIMMMIISH